MRKLETSDPDLAEFITLCAYAHNCHIPLSFEMALDYFNYDDYNEVFYLKDDAMDIIKEYIPVDALTYDNMDYYYPRSLYVAETIMNSVSSDLLKKSCSQLLIIFRQFA